MKRFLSLILTLALICTMLPTVFASEESAKLELAYSYNFGAAGYDSTSAIDEATLITYGDTSEKPDASDKLTWAKTNTDPWVIDGDYYTNTLELTAETVTGSTKKPNAIYWEAWGNRAWDDGVEKSNNGVAIRLEIDKVGTYIPKVTYHARTENCMFEVYLIPLNKIDDGNKSRIYFESSSLVGTLCKSYAQQYIIGMVDMAADEEGTKTVELNKVEVTEETNGDYLLVLVTKGLNETLKAKYEGVDGPKIYGNLYSLALYTEKEKTLDSEFTYTEEEFVGGSATLRAFAVYGDGTDSEEDIIETRDITLGETVEVSAPKSVTKGEKTYNFLYWAKGATDKKQIVSYNAAFTYKAYAEANNLIAVYKEAGAESSAKEYYNANGQLMDGDTLPSLPGYGQATGWADAGNGVYVAEYAPLQKNIKITVNGAEESYAYGDSVVCTANAPEGKVFMYWTKNDEIVSTESTYTFSAWETATVTAVYGDSAPTLGKTMRKILLGTLPAGEDTAVMAEFIGFSDAVEKGIIFGGKKIPMLTDKSQFTLTNDTDGTVEVTGYAIVSDNGTLKEVSDGSISVE